MTHENDDPIDYRYLNMDNQCLTTSDGLHKYAADFPGGIHRVAVSAFSREPVLQAYGRKQYDHNDMIALYSRLSQRREPEHARP